MPAPGMDFRTISCDKEDGVDLRNYLDGRARPDMDTRLIDGDLSAQGRMTRGRLAQARKAKRR